MGSRRRTDEDTAPRSLRKRPHSVLESPYTTDNTRVRGKVSEKRDSLAEVEGSEYEDGDNDIEDDDEQPVRKPGRNRKSLDAVAGRKKKPAERPLEKASTRRDNLENVESSEEEPLKQLAAKRCTLGLGSEGGSKERQVEQPLTASPDERPGRKWVAPAAPIAHAVRKKDSGTGVLLPETMLQC